MIHLIVGNTGAGKTSYARKLKEEINGLIFSIDQWNRILYFPDKSEEDGLSWFLERINREETLIMYLIEQLESLGTDSILDLGLSKFEHREKFRVFAAAKGFQTKLHFLDIPREIRQQRVAHRNKSKGVTFEFEVSQENFDFMESWFEHPSVAELENGIIIKE
jgi:predicted kinase